MPLTNPELFKRVGIKVPLLIGGATTSRMHTAVKIAPMYATEDHPVIHVLDASRAVVVVSNLLGTNDEESKTAVADREEYVSDIMEQYEDMREEYYASLEERTYKTLEEARARAPVIDWAAQPVPKAPTTPGLTTLNDVSIAELIPFIDWTPFFQVWELRGKYPNRGYPKIFNDTAAGPAAKRLFDEAQAMLQKIQDEKWLTPKAVVGLFGANAVGDDIEVYAGEERKEPTAVFHTLRQQADTESDKPYTALSDFIAPKTSGIKCVLCVARCVCA